MQKIKFPEFLPGNRFFLGFRENYNKFSVSEGAMLQKIPHLLGLSRDQTDRKWPNAFGNRHLVNYFLGWHNSLSFKNGVASKSKEKSVGQSAVLKLCEPYFVRIKWRNCTSSIIFLYTFQFILNSVPTQYKINMNSQIK